MNAPSQPADLRLEVVSTLDRFEALRAPWNALAASHPTPLLRHEWFAAAARAHAGDAELAVVLAWDGEALRAAAPLVHDRRGGLDRLRILGFQTDEPEAFLFADEAALARVCAAVAGLGRPVALRRLGADSRELALLQSACRGFASVRPGSTRTLWNPLPADAPALEASMTTKQRREIVRRRKKLDALGAATFEAHAPSVDQVQPLFCEFVAVEGAGWKARAGTALVQDGAQRAFLRDLCRQAAAEGWLRFFFLRQNGRVVAGQLHLLYARRLWALKIGYDETLASLSPGVLLTHDILRHACGLGLEGVEHLGVAESWQQRWPFDVRDHATVRLYPVSAGSAVAFTADALDFVRRRRAARHQASAA